MGAADELRFLVNFQKLLDEGDFSATYKFALLRALADLSVESQGEPQAGLEISVWQIAGKFIEYYWRQARPFRSGRLKQSGKGQAEVLSAITEFQERHTPVLAELRAKPREWERLVRRVARNVERDPLRRLQTLPSGPVNFLYEPPPSRGGSSPAPHEVTVTLKPGVAGAFRRFHPLVLSLLESAWIRRILAIRSNSLLLGESDDLGEFLFGSDRRPLDEYRQALAEVQGHRCFYCESRPRGPVHVDHFIPWARYPADMGHNFVLACQSCNGSKRDHLAATAHLGKWKTVNIDGGDALAAALSTRNLAGDPVRALTVARWAYQQAESAQVSVWVAGKRFEVLGPEWRGCLGVTLRLALAAEEAAPYE